MNTRDRVYASRADDLGAEVTIKQDVIQVRVATEVHTIWRNKLYDYTEDEAKGAAEAVVHNLTRAVNSATVVNG